MEPNNLQMLIEMARTARDAALARRAQLQAQLEQSRAQFEMLQGYQRDYGRKVQSTLAAGSDIAAQNNLRAFLARLEDALTQQRAEIARRESLIAHAHDELADQERRVKSLETLQQRRVSEARRVEDRREQKRQDEMAQVVVARGTELLGAR